MAYKKAKERKMNGSNSKHRSGRRPSRAPKHDEDSLVARQEKGEYAPIRNNASMYFTDVTLAEQVSNISFNTFYGTETIGDEVPIEVASICRLRLNPSPGWLDGNTSEGINAIGLRNYTVLSASNAKTTIYAPQDVSTLILAFGSIVEAVEWLRTVFGVVYTYNVRNRAIPRGLISALGINAEDLFYNVAGHMTRLNAIINKINSIPIPGNITWFEKCAEVFSHIYADANSNNLCQYYITVPYQEWILDESGSEEGSVLKTTPFMTGTGPMPISYYFTQLDNMVNALLGSQTMQFIFSDILRLTNNSEAGLYKIGLINLDNRVVPEFNPMKLLQFHNANAIGAPLSATAEGRTVDNDVIPSVDNNALIYKPRFDNSIIPVERVIDFPNSEGHPDLDQRTDVTRYLTLASSPTAYSDLTLPDHYVVRCEIVKCNGNPRDFYTSWTKVWPGIINATTTNVDELREMIRVMAAISQFDYHPHSLVVDDLEDAFICGDLDYWTVINYDYLSMVNDLTLQGLFTMR